MTATENPLPDACPPPLEAPLSADDAERLANALKVLADPARLRILSTIAAQPSGEACVCQLVTPLGISQPTVSHHLRILHDAGLLHRERRGTWVYYRIDPERLDSLGETLQNGVINAAEALTPLVA